MRLWRKGSAPWLSRRSPPSVDPAGAADESAPVVSPDRIEEAPSIKPDPYPDFDNFGWRAFIALNWPSLTDPAHRGEPDRAKTLGDPGPRVWETFKARYELFQVGSGRAPRRAKTLGDLRSGEPCGADVDNRAKDARDLHALHGFQPIRLPAGRRRQSAGRAKSHLHALRRTHQRTRIFGACAQGLELGPEPARSRPTPRTCR